MYTHTHCKYNKTKGLTNFFCCIVINIKMETFHCIAIAKIWSLSLCHATKQAMYKKRKVRIKTGSQIERQTNDTLY